MIDRIFGSLFLLVICSIVIGCSSGSSISSGGSGSQAGAHADTSKNRFLALGDSYTIGEGVEPSERWPEVLVSMIRAKGFSIGDPQIIAKTGWTTTDLMRAIDRADLKGPYALVTLMIGVNNQFQGKSVEEFRTDLSALIKKALDLAGGVRVHVVVVSIPDWSVSPFAAGKDRGQIAASIDRFNAVVQDLVARNGILSADVTTTSRAATDSTMFAADGLHPSGAQHALWARVIFDPAVGAVMPIHKRAKH
jgi:lysophospholipase L1-like esterase